jgi:short-subunit dehydrogenase involved in D-alanine esterification of teichoic acids
MTIHGKTIWITDASAGLGLQLAEQFAIHGNHVIASGTDETALQRLVERGGGAISRLPLDPGDSRSIQRAAHLLSVMNDRLDLVIIQPEAIEVSTTAPFNAMTMENVVSSVFNGTVRTVAMALPLLQRASKPQLVMVDPAVACRPHPEGIYRAPIAAMDYLAQSLGQYHPRCAIDVSTVRRPPGREEAPLTGNAAASVPASELCRLVDAIEARRAVIYLPRADNPMRKLLAWRALRRRPQRVRESLTNDRSGV